MTDVVSEPVRRSISRGPQSAGVRPVQDLCRVLGIHSRRRRQNVAHVSGTEARLGRVKHGSSLVCRPSTSTCVCHGCVFDLPSFTFVYGRPTAAIYIFMLLFLLLSSFFPSLISAATEWMSAILPHMVWL